ncbi:MAG: amidase [Rhodobacteraceae bacterium]|nr:amidase [Paracoccaceae bacterium]
MSEIITWSAVETAARIRDRSVSVTEVTQAHLDRIAMWEPGLNAVVDNLGETALAQAAEMDRAGPGDGVLHGLPVTIKINVDFAGLPNSNGLPAQNHTPSASDGPVVANYRAAGAIPIGRTNTPEFSLRWFTSNPIHGVTENSVNRALTPGGSSGGASSSVAAGIGVLAHGNDLGGSLRYPAYCCGLATLRPSLGRVPAFNPSAPAERPAMLQTMSVQGSIARNFGDIRLALRAQERRSPLDPLWNGAADSGRTRRAVPRIGVCADPFGDGIAADVATAVDKAAAALKATGAEIVETKPPMAREAADIWGRLLNTETDVMMMDGMRQVGSDQVLDLLQGYVEIFGTTDLKGYMQDQAARLTIQRAWALMFEDIDVLLMPVSGQLPFALEQDFRQRGRLPDIIRAQRFLFIANVLGLPATSVPTGKVDGVPTGVQIIGAWRDDDLCIDISERLETALALDLSPVAPAS